MRNPLLAALLAAAALTACEGRGDRPPAADNTLQNDRGHRTETADNASNNKSDVDVTQKIRKAVMDDSSLSTSAHNCKIVVKDGTVTLVGPVKSDAERVRVAEIAANTAGGNKIDNQLKVAD